MYNNISSSMCKKQGSSLCIPAPEDDEGGGHRWWHTGQSGRVAVWNRHGSDQRGVPEDGRSNTGAVYCCEYNAYQYQRYITLHMLLISTLCTNLAVISD